MALFKDGLYSENEVKTVDDNIDDVPPLRHCS